MNSKHGVKSAKLAISKVQGIWKNFGSNTFIWSTKNVPLSDFFHNVSQSLQTLKLLSILCKKVNFLTRTYIQHFHSCFLVYSYHVSIIQNQNLKCILPSHLFAFLNGVASETFGNFKKWLLDLDLVLDLGVSIFIEVWQ